MPRSPDISLAEAVESFLRSRWDLAPRTKQGYEKSLRRFARRHDLLAELSAENVNAYLDRVADHRTMARNDAIALRQLAQWATKAHIFAQDPLASVALPKGRGGRREPLPDVDIPAIIAAAEESALGIRDKAIVMLAIAAALRPAELWQLDLDDVDIRGGWLVVRRDTTKTDAGARTIPLEPQIVAVLAEYVEDHRPPRDGRLFLNAYGDPFRYWGFMAVFSRLRARLKDRGVEFSAYRQRHTGITNWIRAGVPAPIVQQLAGHRSFVTTQGYVGKMQKSDLARVPHAFSQLYGKVG